MTPLFIASLLAVLVLGWLTLKEVPRMLWTVSKGKRTKGQIIRDHVLSPGRGATYYPVFIFRDEAGTPHEVTSRFQKQTSAREQMVDVEIAYDPDAPTQSAFLVGFRFYWPTALLAGGFISMGVIFAAVAYHLP